MLTLRLVTALATTLVGSSTMITDCENEPDYCPPDQPSEGCFCEVEGELGCPSDGEWHYEAFVCIEGVWVDTAATGEADAAFCGSSSFYGGCFWEEGADSMELACAVPGFIGITKKRAPARRARRARGAGMNITG